MTPVFLLSDGYLANGSEPWLIPNVDELPKIEVKHPTEPNSNGNGDAASCPTSATSGWSRPWAIPGTPGLEHRIGGLEKQDVTGNVSYDPANHEHMVRTRAAEDRQHRQRRSRPARGPARRRATLLVVGWGGTYGAITAAVQRAAAQGLKVSPCHLRYLNPMPKNTRRGAEAVQEGPGARN